MSQLAIVTSEPYPPRKTSQVPIAIALRDYQKACVDAVLSKLTVHSRAYFAMPTGAGKSVAVATIANGLLANGRVLFIVHRSELVGQIVRAIRDVTGGVVATLIDGKLSDPSAMILVSMIQSATPKHIDQWIESSPVAAVIIDEAHHVAKGNLYDKLIDRVANRHPAAKVLGCTATPFRTPGSGRMQAVLKRCLFERSIYDLSRAGYLAPLLPVSIRLRVNLRAIASKSGDYDQSALGAQMMAVVQATVAKTRPHLVSRRCIVFAVNIEHAKALREEYDRAGLPAFFVCGKTSKADRARTVAQWCATNGILVNVDIATEGFDEPSVSAIVLASPTQSAGRYVQRAGRGTRLFPGKTECLIIDVTGSGPKDERQALFADVFQPAIGSGRSSRSKVAKRKLIAGPRDDDGNRWHELVSDSSWMLNIGRDRFWHVCRDRFGSGLWRGELLRIGSLAPPLQSFSDETSAEIISLVRAAIAKEGRNPLVSTNAPWRLEPASESQLRRIGRLRLALPNRARRWTKGRASDALAIYDARRTLELRSGARV